jgi:hypothetical protein
VRTRHDLGPRFVREHAVVPQHVKARWRDQGAQPRDEIERVEHDRMHTILPRVPKVVAAAAISGELEALLGDGRPRDVATQPLKPLAIAAGHGRARGQKIVPLTKSATLRLIG